MIDQPDDLTPMQRAYAEAFERFRALPVDVREKWASKGAVLGDAFRAAWAPDGDTLQA